eukprot:4843611-Pleurochrysis_carterae.AAC.1
MRHLEQRLTAETGPLAHGPPAGKRAKSRATSAAVSNGSAPQSPQSRRKRARQHAVSRWDARRAPAAAAVAAA